MLGAIRKAVASGTAVDLSGWNKDNAVNAFANTTLSSIVLEIPDGAFGATMIGFWGRDGAPYRGWRLAADQPGGAADDPADLQPR